VEEQPQRSESGSLVALLKRMRLRYAGHKPHCEHDNVILAIGKRICGRASALLQQSANRAGNAARRSSRRGIRLSSMTTSIGSHLISFGKGRQDF